MINQLINKAVKILRLFFHRLNGRAVFQWFRDEDKRLRLNYDLSEDSIVFDIGGYEGQWASDIFAKYCCQIYIFEPVCEYAENIKERFKKNPKIHVYPFGLASEDRLDEIAICQDSSSIFKKGRNKNIVKLINIEKFMHEHNIKNVDLIKINIEGGEYELLEYLISNQNVTRFKDIQVQFHKFMPHAEKRRSKIQKELKRTHYLTYQYEFVWENWRRKT